VANDSDDDDDGDVVSSGVGSGVGYCTRKNKITSWYVDLFVAEVDRC